MDIVLCGYPIRNTYFVTNYLLMNCMFDVSHQKCQMSFLTHNIDSSQQLSHYYAVA